MLKYLLFFTLVFSSQFSYSQILSEQVLIDFGPNDGTNGNITESPDDNSNHWNNVTNPVATSIRVNLVNKDGEATGYEIGMNSAMSKNGINHGGLLSSDSELLGDYAVNTATQDYFFTTDEGSLVVENLNPSLAYTFTFFASRANAEKRVTTYDIKGANSSSGDLQSSGSNIGVGDYDGNNDQTFTSNFIFPDTEGKIMIDVNRTEGQFGYINLMEIKSYEDVELVDVEGIEIIGKDININGASSQLEASIMPENATIKDVSWSIDNKSVGIISETGKLSAYQNGNVTVTASSLQQGSEVMTSRSFSISNQATVKYLIDFGPDDGNNGNATILGVNNQQWNNATNPSEDAEVVLLKDASGGESSYGLSVTKSMLSNGLQHGGLTVVDEVLLGDFAIETVTQDYFFSQNTGEITLSNLNPDNGYRFDAFGSRDNSSIRATRYSLSGLNTASGVLITSGLGVGSDEINANNNSLYTSDIVYPDDNGNITFKLSISQGQFAYLNALRITEYIDVDICPVVDQQKISVMGSSVARGQGAPSDMGYAFMYTQLLEDRANDQIGNDWEVVNISVGGNNTIKVLERWDNDLVPQCGEYVIYGLSLGNEGVANTGQVAFDQFRDNMQLLIDQARQRGMQPVVMNNYTREDFGPTEYQFIKDMNLLIHEWDVPSVNLLGAIDNGRGNWATGFQQDFGHPNQAGHREFFYSMVPSLFDALDDGKPVPVRQESEGTKLGGGLGDSGIVGVLRPEHTVHPFTVAFDIMIESSGDILTVNNVNQENYHLGTDDTGRIYYRDNDNNELLSEPSGLGDGEKHNLVLTHYYAMGKTFVYIDGTLVGEGINQNLEPTSIRIMDGENSIATVSQFHFYRSGMNIEEVTALYNGKMLKSSLEVYSPLSAETIIDSRFINLAQSTNQLELRSLVNTEKEQVKPLLALAPNPTEDSLNITLAGKKLRYVELYDSQGQLVLTSSTPHISMVNFMAGQYLVKVHYDGGTVVQKVSKI